MIRILLSSLFLTVLSGCGGSPAVPGSSADGGAPSTQQPVELETPTGTIHGTLLLPDGEGPFPVAVIIAGSGPTDRDGNSPILPGQNNSLRMLAEGLAERGVATVRYDKRGIAQSTPAGPQEADLRFDAYVDDAAAWIALLREDPRFSSVSFIGHSEGSLVGIMAAQIEDVDALVSIAGAAQPLSEVLREQLRPQLPPNLWAESERILGALVGGDTVANVPSELFALYRPSVQPYLISVLPLDPSAEIARVDAPVMIVHGTTDIQVGADEARALHAARPDAELAIIDGMNHILKLVPADMAQQQASYSDANLPVAPEALEQVGEFLRSTAG